MLKYTLRDIISVREIVVGVVRHCDLVAKVKLANIFPWHVSESLKFMLMKISPIWYLWL